MTNKIRSLCKFDEKMSPQRFREIIEHNDKRYANDTAFRLTVGQVRLELAFVCNAGKLGAEYYCSVRDRKLNGEWILYDAVHEKVNLSSTDSIESEMLDVLDRYVSSQNLSYTKCNSEIIESKKLDFNMKY